MEGLFTLYAQRGGGVKNEYGLIEYFSRIFSAGDKRMLLGPGDDCAVFDIGGKKALVLTVDELVEGTHFLARFSEPELVAAKLVRVSVSDIYSMGPAVPLTCLVSSGLNGRLPPRWVERFASALKKECRVFGMSVAGGNMARSRELHFAMTVVGLAKKKEIISRKGASPGDAVYALGSMGGARAGLEILKKSVPVSAVEKRLAGFFWRPPIFAAEAALLRGLATSMLDNSDGLYKSLGIISGLNGVRITAGLSGELADKALISWCRTLKKDWKRYALAGGEDYGLIFTVKKRDEEKLKKLVPRCRKVGTVERGKGVLIENYDGEIPAFEHF